MSARRARRLTVLGFAAMALLVAAGAVTEYAVDTKREVVDRAMKMTGGDPEGAPALLRHFGCAGCHTIPGVPGARGRVGPPLAGLAQRVYVAGTLPNTPDNVIKFILHPRAYSPNTAMPVTGIDERGARDVTAYLYRR
jgi:cytochrome c2